MPQRVIHPINRTPASSSLANFKVQQASRIKRSIFATLVVIQRATTDTTFSKDTWHQKPTQTINFLGINQPDREVHLERPQTQHSAKGTWHQIGPRYHIRGKAEGTATNPKKTQRAATTSYPNPHHGPGDVEWQKPTQTKSFWVLISRIKRSIFATRIVIQKATTDTTFSKGTWQQSKPQYQTWGKTYGTVTDPKKTQRAESLHSKFAATWQGNRLHSKFTANANPHHGPGDVDWQKPSQH